MTTARMKRRSGAVELFQVGRHTRLGNEIIPKALDWGWQRSRRCEIATRCRRSPPSPRSGNRMPLDGEENDMQSKLLNDSNGQRTFAVILETGDEVQDCMKTFIEAEGIRAAQLTAIGAFSDVELLYFDWKAKKYHNSASRAGGGCVVDRRRRGISLGRTGAAYPRGRRTAGLHSLGRPSRPSPRAADIGSPAYREPNTFAQKVRHGVRPCSHSHGDLSDSVGAEAFGNRPAIRTFRFRSSGGNPCPCDPEEIQMPTCETCGNDYDKAFQVTMNGQAHTTASNARFTHWRRHASIAGHGS